MTERMIARVVAELREVNPNDSDELLRAIATKTTLGAAIAWRLAVQDLGKSLEPYMRRACDTLRRILRHD